MGLSSLEHPRLLSINSMPITLRIISFNSLMTFLEPFSGTTCTTYADNLGINISKKIKTVYRTGKKISAAEKFDVFTIFCGGIRNF